MTTATNSLPPERSIHMRIAHSADAKAIARIINAAFVVERMAFDGDRINALGVSDLMKKGPFLLAEDAIELAGCVYVEVRGARSYLGLLSVGPARQGTGLGRLLVAEAEEYSNCGSSVRARNLCCRSISTSATLKPERLPFPPT
jgi:predicted N-acetyltransferase YhbS